MDEKDAEKMKNLDYDPSDVDEDLVFDRRLRKGVVIGRRSRHGFVIPAEPEDDPNEVDFDEEKGDDDEKIRRRK